MEWPDGKQRCCWANPANPRYVAYHDDEWGVPVHDDDRLFEMLVLECFQAGLSWECILNKREAFRRAFDGFDLDAVCAYGQQKVEALLQDASIVRNRLKVGAAITNARIFRSMQEEHGELCRLPVGLDRRQGGSRNGPCHLAAFRRGVRRPQAARHEVRGIDRRLCVPAGSRRDRFSRGRLLPAREVAFSGFRRLLCRRFVWDDERSVFDRGSLLGRPSHLSSHSPGAWLTTAKDGLFLHDVGRSDEAGHVAGRAHAKRE